MRWVAVVLLVAGCQGGFRRVVRAPTEPLHVAAVVIYPVRLTGTAAAGWRSFELGQRLVDVALAEHGEQLAVFGASEVQVSRWEDPSWTASSAIPLLIRSAVRAEEAVVLRTTAEQRVAQSAMERRDKDDRAKGGLLSEETTWVCTVELLHPSSQQVLAELTGQVTVDPFSPTGEEEYDTAAPMTHLLERMAADALALTRQWPPSRPWPAVQNLPFKPVLTPAVTVAQPDTPLSTMDALDMEVWVQSRARFLAPSLGPDEVSTVAKLPAGLWVTRAGGATRLQDHDLIVSVDGQPALPQLLARTRLKGVPAEVVVLRGSERIETVVP